MPSDFDDYSNSAWRFRANTRGVHASHRADHPEPAPSRVMSSERSGRGGDRPARVQAYCPSRLERAIERPIKKLGPGRYAVKGNVERVYYIDLSQDPPCTCLDRFYRNVRCLHELAARIQEREPAFFQALVDRYVRQRERLRNAGLLNEDE